MDGLMNILSTAAQQGEGDKICELIEECGGLDKIEDLQSHENEQVYKKALAIITTFFGEEEVSKKKCLFQGNLLKNINNKTVGRPGFRRLHPLCTNVLFSVDEMVQHCSFLSKKFSIFFSWILLNFVQRTLKVSSIQNEFMRSSFLPKCQPKITKIPALTSNKLPGQNSW